MKALDIQSLTKSGNRRAFVFLAAVLFFMIFRPHPGLSWESVVVDKQTGESIEGTAIVRMWKRIYPGLFATSYVLVGTKEGVSDVEGQISVPWLLYFPGIPIFAWAEENPAAVYKPGYKFLSLQHPIGRIELERVPTLLGARRKEWREATNDLSQTIDQRGTARFLKRFWDIWEREAEFLQLLEWVTAPRAPPPLTPLRGVASSGIGLSIATPTGKVAPAVRARVTNKGADERRADRSWCGNESPVNSACSIDSLCSILADKDQHPLRRTMAADLLGRSGDSRTVNPLLRAAGDELPQVRARAIVALGHIRDPRVLEFLIFALGDNDKSVRFHAADALTALGKPAVEPLIRALTDKDRRGHAAAVLGRIGDHRAVEPLIAAYEANDPNISVAAGLALINFKDPRAVAVYVQALRDKNHVFSQEAKRALVLTGKSSTNTVLTLLKEKNPELRAIGAEILGGLKDTEATVPLITCLKDPDAVVRTRAATSLGHLQDPRAVPHLVNAWDDESSSVRSQASEALTAIGKPAVPSLTSALRSRNSYIRWRAAWCMGQIGDISVVDTLIDVLRDKTPEVRWTIVVALGRLGDKNAIGPLATMCADNDEGIRDIAKASIQKIAGGTGCP